MVSSCERPIFDGAIEFYENDFFYSDIYNDNDILLIIELFEKGHISLNDLEFCDFIIY